MIKLYVEWADTPDVLTWVADARNQRDLQQWCDEFARWANTQHPGRAFTLQTHALEVAE